MTRLLRALNEDWEALVRHRHDHQAEVRGWARVCPAFAGCRGPDDVLAAIAAAPDPALADLIASHQDGSALAGRIVLQTMLGKMVLLAARDPGGSLDDYIAELWCEIRTYPLQRRPRSIAANLALDTRKAVRRDQDRQRRQRAITREAASLALRALPARVADLSASRVLRAAGELGVIDEATTRLLVAVYVEGRPGREVAQRGRISHQVVRFRCSRAVRRMAARAGELAAVA